MERSTSIGRIQQRLSGHKPDNGHLAADVASDDVKPLIGIVEAAIRETGLSDDPKVLYLKQDPRGKFFLTTNVETPRQSQAYKPSSLWPVQRFDATGKTMARATYWMKQRPNNHKVQAAGAALIDFCINNGMSESGLACTAGLRDRLQDLHDAIHAPEPPIDAIGRKDSAGGKSGIFRSLRRSLTIEKKPGSGVNSPSSPAHSRDTSPQKGLGGSTHYSPRVSYAYDADVRYVPASPRKPPRRRTSQAHPAWGKNARCPTPCRTSCPP